MINNILRQIFVWSILIVFSINMLFASDEKLITEIQLHKSDTVFRHTFLYDQQKRVLLETRSFNNSTGWLHLDQTEWVYYESKPDMQIGRKWKDNNWVDEYVIKQSHEANISKEEFFKGTASAENIQKYTQKIFENGLLIQRKTFQNVTGQSQLIDSVVFDYNSEKLLSETHYSKQDNGELSIFMFEYDYDTYGNLFSMKEKELLGDTLWQENSESIWYYKSGTTLVSSKRLKTRDSKTGFLENSKMERFRYDQAGRLVEELYFYWNSMVWENKLRYVYQYNEQGELLNKQLSMPVYNQWRNSVNINYLANQTDDVLDIESVYGFWGGNEGEFVASRIPYSFNGEMRIAYGQKMQITYSLATDVNVRPFSNKAIIRVYPNPSSGIFYYNPAEIEVISWIAYDVNGRKVKVKPTGQSTGIIDLSDKPNAVYFLKVITAEGFINAKLIKNE